MTDYAIAEFFIRQLKPGAKITATLGEMKGETIYKVNPDSTYPDGLDTEFFRPSNGTIVHWSNCIDCEW